MYKRSGRIPDLAHLEQFFRPKADDNVIIVRPEVGYHIPILVDVNYGKMQRSRSLGPTWSRAIAYGVSRFVKKLEATEKPE